MSEDQTEPVGVQFARLTMDGSHRARVAEQAAEALFEELRGQFGRKVAHEAFAAVVERSSAVRGDGAPSGQTGGRDRLWLAIHDWQKEQAPRKALAVIAREIAANPANGGASAQTVRKRLNKLLDDRRLSDAQINATLRDIE